MDCGNCDNFGTLWHISRTFITITRCIIPAQATENHYFCRKTYNTYQNDILIKINFFINYDTRARVANIFQVWHTHIWQMYNIFFLIKNRVEKTDVCENNIKIFVFLIAVAEDLIFGKKKCMYNRYSPSMNNIHIKQNNSCPKKSRQQNTRLIK